MKTVDLEQAIEVLQQGKILIYPTETLYGLGVDATQKSALDRLKILKGREANKPISVLVSGFTMMNQLVEEITDKHMKIINQFMPGPLTLVLPAAPSISVQVAHDGWIGIRWSSHSIAQQLVEAYGKPITSTSVNPSGEPPAYRMEDIEKYFKNESIAVLSGGDLPKSVGSTVIQIDGNTLKRLREGEIPLTEIEKVWMNSHE